VDHLEYVAAVAGIDHVGLGPDFIQEVFADTTPPCCELDAYGAITYLPGLEGPSGLPLVTEALIRRGWPAEHIAKVLGANVVRLFRNELGRAG
jgi:membrane dipeptidase